MGKVANLSIGKVNIKPHAVEDTVVNTTTPGASGVTITVPNPRSFPVDLAVGITVTYTATHVNAAADFIFTLTRLRDSKVIYTERVARSGNTGGNPAVSRVNFAATDDAALTNEQYRLSVTINTAGTPVPGASVSNSSFIGIWSKR